MAAGDDVSDVVGLASISEAAAANTSDVVGLASFYQAAAANASDVVGLASFYQAAVANASDVVVLISYVSPQPPPWTLTGSQSPSDAVSENPNSGASSPYESNRDADRGIK